jgi:hypothetical protein
MIFSRQQKTVTGSDSFTSDAEALQRQPESKNPEVQQHKESLLFRFTKETLEFLFIPP